MKKFEALDSHISEACHLLRQFQSDSTLAESLMGHLLEDGTLAALGYSIGLGKGPLVSTSSLTRENLESVLAEVVSHWERRGATWMIPSFCPVGDGTPEQQQLAHELWYEVFLFYLELWICLYRRARNETVSRRGALVDSCSPELDAALYLQEHFVPLTSLFFKRVPYEATLKHLESFQTTRERNDLYAHLTELEFGSVLSVGRGRNGPSGAFHLTLNPELLAWRSNLRQAREALEFSPDDLAELMERQRDLERNRD